MKLQELKCNIRHVSMPVQPLIEVQALDYRKKLTRLNPFTEKEGGLFYQFRTSETGDFTASFIPDGCVNMLFSCDEKKPEAMVFGIYDRIHEEKLKPDTQYFGAIPFSGFLGIKAWKATPTELREHGYDLTDVTGDRVLCERITALNTFDERVRFFKEYFLQHLADINYYNTLPGVMSLYSCCAAGNFTANQLQDMSGYSYSYCRKTFLDHYGITIKRYAQGIRLSQAMNMLLNADPQDHNIVNIAMKAGFYDESHFINEFKRYIGYSPRKFVKHISDLQDKSTSKFQ